MSDKVYIYGDQNGATYDAVSMDGDPDGSVNITGRKTHWDPRVEVSAFGGHGVQVGIVPPSITSTDEGGIWTSDDGQFLHLNRDGINRLIRALREARVAVYGKDE